MTVDKAARRIQGGFLTGPTQFKYQKENHQLKNHHVQSWEVLLGKLPFLSFNFFNSTTVSRFTLELAPVQVLCSH